MGWFNLFLQKNYFSIFSVIFIALIIWRIVKRKKEFYKDWIFWVSLVLFIYMLYDSMFYSITERIVS